MKIENTDDWKAIEAALIHSHTDCEITYDERLIAYGHDSHMTKRAKEHLERVIKAREILKKY